MLENMQPQINYPQYSSCRMKITYDGGNKIAYDSGNAEQYGFYKSDKEYTKKIVGFYGEKMSQC